MIDPLADCTEAQIKAITHPGGPLLVLAGAGSGKTRVITRRIAWLIGQGVRPWDIVAITFTNKAADEMRERVVQLCGAESMERGLWVSTFHAMCARILRHHADRLGYTSQFSIYDTGDGLSLIRRLTKELEIPKEDNPPGAYLGAISNMKNDMMSPEAVAEEAADPFHINVGRVYRLYRDALKESNAMDFDDLLLKVVELFDVAPDVKDRYAERFRHILVDEYQDTNRAQYRIAATLAQRHRNICVTGDPDQSIYGWRGADISNILEFENEYTDATLVVLDKNYRSTKIILDAANHVIANNAQRKHKELHTDNPEGVPLRVVTLEDEVAEGDFLATDMRRKVSVGGSYDDVAIFYRTNAQSRAIETALREAGVPHRIVQGVSFFERKEVKDVIAYLRVCVNPSDSGSLDRILNVPSRGLGGKSRERLRAFAAREGVPLVHVLEKAAGAGISKRQAESCRGLASILRAVRETKECGVVERIELLLAKTQYRLYLRDGFQDAADRDANVAEILNLAGQYQEQAEEDEPSLSGFLERAALSSDQDALDLAQGAVKLMTLHTAKGLEFPRVYITGLEERLLPLDKEDGDFEEERRLFFVGLTRAMREVTLTRALMRRRYGRAEYTEPSRFLNEIPQGDREEEGLPIPMEAVRGERELEQVWQGGDETAARDTNGTPLREGDRVRHPTFGGGTLLRFSGSGDRLKAIVRFARVGEKTLMLKFARLEKVLR